MLAHFSTEWSESSTPEERTLYTPTRGGGGGWSCDESFQVLCLRKVCILLATQGEGGPQCLADALRSAGEALPCALPASVSFFSLLPLCCFATVSLCCLTLVFRWTYSELLCTAGFCKSRRSHQVWLQSVSCFLAVMLSFVFISEKVNDLCWYISPTMCITLVGHTNG